MEPRPPALGTQSLNHWKSFHCYGFRLLVTMALILQRLLSENWSWWWWTPGGKPQKMLLPFFLHPSLALREHSVPDTWLHLAGSATLGWPLWTSTSTPNHGDRPVHLEEWLGVYKDDQKGWPHIQLLKEYLLMVDCTRCGGSEIQFFFFPIPLVWGTPSWFGDLWPLVCGETIGFSSVQFSLTV